jgi:hypothetical protein
MSLIRFLAVGRSFGTVADAPTRYRMRQEHLLPRFGVNDVSEPETAASVGQPGFVHTGAGPAMPVVAATDVAASAMDESGHASEAVTAAPVGSVEAGAGTETTAGKEPTTPATVGKRPFRLSAWLRGRPSGGEARPGARGKSAQSPVQLALDLVTPVRNDLRDADIEIVPVRTTPVNAQNCARESADPSGGSAIWHQLTTRWLRSR